MGIKIWKQIRLPAEYQEVEYIETTGSQYIDTGYTAQSGDTAEIKFNMLTCTGDEQWIFAIWQSPYGYRAGAESHGTSWKTNNGFSYDTTGLNTDIIATGSCTHTFSKNSYLFAQNENNTPYHLNKGTMRLYYCKLSRGGTLVRDFVPCYRIADSVIGLYDLANDVFYTNSGSGTFIKGADITNITDISKIYIGDTVVTPVTSFRYIKWYIDSNKGATVTQMSEFEICDTNGTKMSRPAGTSITATKNGNSGEGIDKLIDGSISTKYCTPYAPPITITIDLGTTVDFSTYCKYKRYTANDSYQRDPITWTISLSNDGSNWTEVSNISNATITTSRNALAGTWDITIPAPSPYKEIRKIFLGSTQIRPEKWHPTANTLGYWKLNGDANDYSTNNNDGTIYNANWLSENNRQYLQGAWSTSRTGAYVKLPIIPVTQFTACLRAKKTGTNSSYGCLFGIYPSGGNTTKVGSISANNSNYWSNVAYGNSMNDVGNTSIGTGWHMLTWVVSDGDIRFYYDTTLKDNKTYTGINFSNSNTYPRYINANDENQNTMAIAYGDVILESAIWDDSKVAQVYDIFKGDYGIS